MNHGYNKTLYLLPFDHRNSYVTDMFDFKLPLSSQQRIQISDSKLIIYEGFRKALADGVSGELAGILVDEEFGADVLRDAHRRDFVTALSVEKSGSSEFEFEYGEDFASHIEAFDPTFVKVLVRYNPERDDMRNQRQSWLLRQVSNYCCRSGRRFMFELLVPATEFQMKSVSGNKDAFDNQIRPLLMKQAIIELQDVGIEPDIWKIEGLARREDCERLVQTARRDGRIGVGCIVLGRGADEVKVRGWLTTAAGVDGCIGFAVGRTTFWNAVAGYRAQTLARAEAAVEVSRRLREWIDIFEREHRSRAAGVIKPVGATS